MSEGGKPNAHEIYESLRSMIINLEIRPAARLTEQRLSEFFSVSRTPIRSALQRLASEGLIAIRPKQGCFVRNIDIAEISEYYDVRIHLETLVLAEIARVGTPPPTALGDLAARWDPERRLYGSVVTDELKAAEEAFHVDLARISGHRALLHYIVDVNERIRVVRLFGWPDEQSVTDTYAEHARICGALMVGDLETSRREMIDHIRKSQENANRVTLKQLYSGDSNAFFD